jgi:hypothetical protein
MLLPFEIDVGAGPLIAAIADALNRKASNKAEQRAKLQAVLEQVGKTIGTLDHWYSGLLVGSHKLLTASNPSDDDVAEVLRKGRAYLAQRDLANALDGSTGYLRGEIRKARPFSKSKECLGFLLDQLEKYLFDLRELQVQGVTPGQSEVSFTLGSLLWALENPDLGRWQADRFYGGATWNYERRANVRTIRQTLGECQALVRS